MADPELVPVRIGGHIVAYRPASESPKKTSAKSAAKKATTRSAATAEEATE